MDQPWESSRLGEPEEEPGLPRAPHCPRVKKWSEAVCPSCFSCCCLGAQSASDSLRPHGLQPPGFSVRGISQARILEWVVSSFSRGSSRPRDRTQVSWTAGEFFTIEPPKKPSPFSPPPFPTHLKPTPVILPLQTSFLSFAGTGH